MFIMKQTNLFSESESNKFDKKLDEESMIQKPNDETKFGDNVKKDPGLDYGLRSNALHWLNLIRNILITPSNL